MSGGFVLDDEDHQSKVILTDPAARSLLKLLTQPQKGRNKLWQDRMVKKIFEKLDRNDDGDLTRSEFLDAFVNPQLAGEDNFEVGLSRNADAMVAINAT